MPLGLYQTQTHPLRGCLVLQPSHSSVPPAGPYLDGFRHTALVQADLQAQLALHRQQGFGVAASVVDGVVSMAGLT